MSETVLNNDIKRTIWERQSGMCALTGKKFDEFNESIEANFIFVNPDEANPDDLNNIVMVWKSQELPKGKLHKYHFPYANFANYGVDEKVAEVKNEVENVVSLSKSDEEWRTVRNLIREVSTTLNTVGIPNTNKNELRELLVEALDNVNQKQSVEAEKNRTLCNENYEMLKAKTLEAIEFAKTSQYFKESREKLISVQKEIKSHKLLHDHRSELEKMINEIFNELNQKQSEHNENYEMECIENYYKLRTLVDNSIKTAQESETFNDAKRILIAAQNEIRDKVLTRKQKDELYKSIRDVFDALREKFNEVRLSDEEVEAIYNDLKKEVVEAVDFAKTSTTEQVFEARENLINMQNKIKESKIRRVQSNELFSLIREVFEKINRELQEEKEQYEAETNANYSKLLEKVDVIIVEIENGIDFNQSADSLTAIKTEMQLLRLKRDHRSKLFDKIREAFALLSRMREMYNKRKSEEKVHKLDTTIANLSQKANRLSSLLKKDNEMLEEQTNKLAVETDETTKSSISHIIDVIKSRIEEHTVSLKATQDRIDDIKNEISKMAAREEEHAKENNEKEAEPAVEEQNNNTAQE